MTAWPTRLSIAATALLCVSYLLVRKFPHERYDGDDVIIGNFATDLQLLLTASAIIALAIGVWTMRRGSRVGWMPTLLVLGAPVLCCMSVLENIAPYRSLSSLSVDGEEYHLLYSHFLQGTTLSITRIVERNSIETRYRVLASAAVEGWAGYLDVVQPVASPPAPVLWVTSDKKLVAIFDQNRVFAAYDLLSGKRYEDICSGAQNCFHIGNLSPFLLLGPSSTPLQSDFDVLLDPKNIGRPKRNAIAPDLQHANPAVREMAKKLDKSLREHPSQNEDYD